MGNDSAKKEDDIDNIISYFKGLSKEMNNRLNIFVYGNNHNLKQFKIKLFNKDFPNIKFKKHEQYDWFFNFYDKEKENVFNIILYDINNDILRNEENNILIFLFNSIKLDKNIIIKLFEILPKISKCEDIFLLFSFESENTPENNEFTLIKDIIKENKLDNHFLSNMKIVYYTPNDFSQIINELFPISSYYNNIGDIYSYLDLILYKDFNPTKTDIIANYTYNATFNIIVLGRIGCGKSTLTNLILNEKKAKVGIDENITKSISKYIHKKYPITILDTPGIDMENGGKYFCNYLKLYRFFFSYGKNKIHLVLYLINSSNERFFTSDEIKIIKYIQETIQIPIFFIVTRTENEKNSKKIKESVKLYLIRNGLKDEKLNNNIYCCQLLNESNNIIKRFGIKELLQAINKEFNKEKELLNKVLSNKNSEKVNNEISKFLNNSFFFGSKRKDLKKYLDFEDYLKDLSKNIIDKYSLQSKNNLIKNIDNINIMMINNLAFEFGQKIDGFDYYIKNKKNFEQKKKNFTNRYEKDQNVLFTEAVGELTEKYLLKDLINESNNINVYLFKIVEDYITALNSFLKLNEDIDKNEIY